jgi:hypothetical protein
MSQWRAVNYRNSFVNQEISIARLSSIKVVACLAASRHLLLATPSVEPVLNASQPHQSMNVPSNAFVGLKYLNDRAKNHKSTNWFFPIFQIISPIFHWFLSLSLIIINMFRIKEYSKKVNNLNLKANQNNKKWVTLTCGHCPVPRIWLAVVSNTAWMHVQRRRQPNERLKFDFLTNYLIS